MTNSDPHPEPSSTLGANEPITLSDPDGAITRVAPWSTWTREQVRAPGGEPSLVTHLKDGQLWFAAGRTRSPWHHEIRIGRVSVTTPRGRFHASAAQEGGATVACLAGRTRVLVEGGEPLVLRENQTAAISSDGNTVVVTQETPFVDPETVPLAAFEPRDDAAHVGVDGPPEARSDTADDSLLPIPAPRRSRAVVGVSRVAAVVAIVAVAVASLSLLLRDRGDDDAAGAVDRRVTQTTTGPAPTGPPATRPGTAPQRTTEPRDTTTEAKATTSSSPATTAPPATQAPAPPATIATVRSSPDAVAVGRLNACKRVDGGVLATVDVIHTKGGVGRFRVEIAVVDGAGRRIATSSGETALLTGSDSAVIEVRVPVAGKVAGSCQILGVTAF